MTAILFFLASQVDDLIHCTSHTLQLLIEYDPVRQCLDGLRLGSPRTPLGVPATSRMRLSSPSDTVLERTEVADDSTLKRRSLRYSKAAPLVSARAPSPCLELLTSLSPVQTQQQHLQVARPKLQLQRDAVDLAGHRTFRVPALAQQLLSPHLPSV